MDRIAPRFEVDIFSLSEHIKTILAFEITKEYLILFAGDQKIYRYIYGKHDSLNKGYEISSALNGNSNDKKNKNNINKSDNCRIFCDKSGNHVLLKYSDHIYYFNHQTSTLYDLPKLLNIDITSVYFNNEDNYNPLEKIIIGDSQSMLYDYSLTIDKNKPDKLKEKLTLLITFITNNTTTDTITKIGAISGLYIKYNHRKSKMMYILVTTYDRLYQFIGESLKMIFDPLINNPSLLDLSCIIFPTEINQNLPLSKLQIIYDDDDDNGNDELSSFGWQCNGGFCQFSFNNEPVPFIDTFTITPYEKRLLERKIRDIPKSVAHSKFHIFLLYKDSLIAISKISSNIVYKYNEIDFEDIQYDMYLNVLWGRTRTALYQLQLDVEERILWQDYIEMDNYSSAINSINNPTTLKQVHKIIGDIYAEKNMLNEATVHYSKSNAIFEDVCFKMYNNNNYESLLIYLESIIKRIPTKLKDHRCIIVTLMLQLYLYKINSYLKADDIPHEISKAINFLTTNKHYIDDKAIIYHCLLEYGFIEPYLRFAELIGDYESVVLYYINSLKIDDALEKFEFLTASKPELSEVFNKYTQVLMNFNQNKTIELLLERKLQLNIDSNQIIFTMMKIEHDQIENMCRYLHIRIEENGLNDKNLHNLYLYFLSQAYDNPYLKQKCLINYLEKQLVNYIEKNRKEEDEDKEMLRYSITKETIYEIPFEIEYALKLFNHSMLSSAQALVLAMKDKYSEAVKIALKHNEVNIAKFIAMSVDSKKLKKSLWIEIFKDQIQKVNMKQQQNNSSNSNFDIDIQQCLSIIDESKILKIEDVLSYLLDNIRIEKIKDQIKACLGQYEENLGNIRKNIEEYHTTSYNLKEDLKKIKKKAIDIHYNSCQCDICHRDLKSEKIILFPCGHMFDRECILSTIKKYANSVPSAIEKQNLIVALMNKTNYSKKDSGKKNVTMAKKLEERILSGLKNIITLDSDMKAKEKEMIEMCSKNNQKSIEDIQMALNKILMEECVKCGKIVIESIKYPYSGDEYSWIIN